MNDKISPKERGLIKGALRRVFSRSDLRRRVLDAVEVVHSDPTRPRVKKWAVCEICKEIKPKYLFVVDHRVPVIALDSSLDDMTWDDLIDRMWCDANNLQAICQDPCHLTKTSAEAKVRREHKKLKRNLDVNSKGTKKKSKKRSTPANPRTTHKRVRVRTIQDFRGKSQKTRR